MSQSTIRIVAATIAFAVVAIAGIVALNFSGDTAVTTWAYLTLAALGVAFVVYAAIEYLQTRSFDSITSQFDTRTLVLMPIAIALNIILGQTVAAAIKLPIYLDSIGTILVGVLAGPLAGALTGLLSNLLWTFCCPLRFITTTRPRSRSWRSSSACLPARSPALGWMRPAADHRHDAPGDRRRRGDCRRRHPGPPGVRRLDRSSAARSRSFPPATIRCSRSWP